MQIKIHLKPAWRRDLTPADRRLWLLGSIGLRIHVRAVPLWEFVIYWKRLLVIGLGLASATYVGVVTAVHWRWKQMPENRVTWTAIAAAPWRWEELRVLRGETAVATGMKQLREGQFSAAIFNLRAGVARAPGSIEGRLALAEVLAAAGEPGEAMRLIAEGVAQVPGSEVLIRTMLGMYGNAGSWTRLLEATDALLAPDREPALDPVFRQRIVHQRATALIEVNRVSDARLLLQANPAPVDTAEGRAWLLQETLALKQLGRLDEARALYAARGGRDAASVGLPGVELALARELGDEPAVESALRRLKSADPAGVDSLLVAYQTWHEIGRETLRDAVQRDFVTFHAGNEQALQRFAKLQVELGQLEGLERLRFGVAQAKFNLFAYDVGLTEIYLRQGRWADALKSLDTWSAQVEQLPERQRAYPEFVRRLVRATVTNNTGEIGALLAHVAALRGQLPPSVFATSAGILERAERPAVALDLLRAALRRYPFVDQLVQAEARLATVVAALPGAAEARPAARAEMVLPELAATLAAVDAAIARGAWDEAAAEVRVWKASSPTPDRAAERAITLRELKIALRRDEAAAARFAVRRFLDRQSDTEAALALLALAAELKTTRPEAAQLLQTEVATARLSVPEVAAALEAQGFAGSALVSADEARRQLETAFAAKNYDQAAQLIRLVRRAAPDWLPTIESELVLAELRARALAREVPSAVLVWRDLLRRHAAMRPAAFEFVRALAREGHAEVARALVDDAVRLRPEDEEVRALRSEVEWALRDKR